VSIFKNYVINYHMLMNEFASPFMSNFALIFWNDSKVSCRFLTNLVQNKPEIHSSLFHEGFLSYSEFGPRAPWSM
jgi:hypothetical protein